MLDSGTVLNDRYEIKEKIGAGGMSIVYRAKCRKLHRDVAIKVLRNEYVEDQEFLASFKAEALSAASLSHPNIVGIYDVGNDLGRHYIVMEYIEGKTLKELIDENAPYDTAEVLDFGINILSAVRHAHMKKIIHRDIKPQNILVTDDGIIKVTDFGIARAVDSATIVSTGNAVGSVHYFSPEQARGKYVDETSDLYSCGIVLFELATGKLPFQADSHVTVALKHINEALPAPSSINANIAPTLENIILIATQKRKELRYTSAQNMLQDMMRLRSNPGYKVIMPVHDLNQETILMTPEETDLIRKQANENAELNIPVWEGANPLIEDDYEEDNDLVDDQLEDDEDDDEISSSYKAMVTVAGVLSAVVLIGIVTALILPIFNKLTKSKAVVVPDLLGQYVEEATREIEKLGLKIEVVDELDEEGIEAGKIIKQSPEKEQVVPKGTTIEVIISAGMDSDDKEGDEVIVPSLANMDFVDAQSMLADRGLVMQITSREFDNYLEAGMIISQDPVAGDTLKEGDVVTVIVSKGKEIKLATVPNVVGRDEATAAGMLRDSGLQVGDVKYEESETVEKGKVISQSVPEGRQVERSLPVSMVVSKGKPQEEPKPEPEKPAEQEKPTKTKNLSISIPDFLEDKDSYQILVRLLSDSGEVSTVYQGTVNKDQFPIVVPVKGKGKGTVETYIDNEAIYADPIDFN
ncbi:MAG: Stk1 family PASTA domain-containing Ser/Thr kinase [Epulopiscium sp.]|nr:Stk1 family PASTA domain-containing Ser/Thr kinase [Candidatus Epulonipiscium sp.]